MELTGRVYSDRCVGMAGLVDRLSEIEAVIALREDGLRLARGELVRARRAVERAERRLALARRGEVASARRKVREARERERERVREVAVIWGEINGLEDEFISVSREIIPTVVDVPTVVDEPEPVALTFGERLARHGAPPSFLEDGGGHAFFVCGEKVPEAIFGNEGEIYGYLDLLETTKILEEFLREISPYPSGTDETAHCSFAGFRLRVGVRSESWGEDGIMRYEAGSVAPGDPTIVDTMVVFSGWHRVPIKVASTLDFMWSDLERHGWTIVGVAIEILYREEGNVGSFPTGEVQ